MHTNIRRHFVFQPKQCSQRIRYDNACGIYSSWTDIVKTVDIFTITRLIIHCITTGCHNNVIVNLLFMISAGELLDKDIKGTCSGLDMLCEVQEHTSSEKSDIVGFYRYEDNRLSSYFSVIRKCVIIINIISNLSSFLNNWNMDPFFINFRHNLLCCLNYLQC